MSIDQLISFRKQKKMKRRKTNETMYVRASPWARWNMRRTGTTTESFKTRVTLLMTRDVQKWTPPSPSPSGRRFCQPDVECSILKRCRLAFKFFLTPHVFCVINVRVKKLTLGERRRRCACYLHFTSSVVYCVTLMHVGGNVGRCGEKGTCVSYTSCHTHARGSSVAQRWEKAIYTCLYYTPNILRSWGPWMGGSTFSFSETPHHITNGKKNNKNLVHFSNSLSLPPLSLSV
jgi:hypothetical protein